MDKKLTTLIKQYALDLGVDLVGFANIERFAKAPPKMSPQGILPTAKTVIVCALHHPDPVIELEGGEHGQSQIMESYGVQMVMNSKLDHISFSIANFLDEKGFPSVPIVSSNIWRYRSYKELDAVFAPDMSHIYASVCAGLTEMGWSGIAISPEYGPRNRFVSIITEAELEPTPLYDGEKLCDMCGECIKYCPADAFRKEVNGVNVLEIEDKVHKFANKNLWRCSWGEHFGLDLDVEIPDIVTEQVILDTIKKIGLRGGEMGTCLKVCVPPKLRFYDPEYTKYARRRRLVAPDDLPVSRRIYTVMADIVKKFYGDRISILSSAKMEELGVNINKKLPEAKNAIFLSAKINAVSELPETFKWKTINPAMNALRMSIQFAAYEISQTIERMGYSVMPCISSVAGKGDQFVPYDLEEGETAVYQVIYTSAPLDDKDYYVTSPKADNVLDLREILEEAAYANGGDLFGIASVGRIDSLKAQLTEIKQGEKILAAYDKNQIFKPYEPVVNETKRELLSPSQYISDAKSVIVIGTHFTSAVSERAGKPPAEAVGPYIFSQFQVLRETEFAALEVVKELNRAGYKAYMVHDLLGMGSFIGSPRGEYSSPFDGTLEAAAVGIGEITYNGNLYTDQYGINQRFICVVTDAVLPADSVLSNT
ncbi:MAG: hypothetical protein FWF15_10170, partial [Oscillospiraceae bacterium]|nr:hypothetical protein [Oscillospiraceae bacterium]